MVHFCTSFNSQGVTYLNLTRFEHHRISGYWTGAGVGRARVARACGRCLGVAATGGASGGVDHGRIAGVFGNADGAAVVTALPSLSAA